VIKLFESFQTSGWEMTPPVMKEFPLFILHYNAGA